MLRPFEHLVRSLRRHSPGGRERLALRLLHAIVVEPVPRVVPIRRESGDSARFPGRV